MIICIGNVVSNICSSKYVDEKIVYVFRSGKDKPF